MGWQDGLVGVGTCCQAQQPEFNPWDQHKDGKEPTASCLLTSTQINKFCTHTNKFFFKKKSFNSA